MTKDEIIAVLEREPWPSFVREMKRTKTRIELYADGIAQNHTQFGYGGYVSVPEIGSGVEVRRTRRPDILEESRFVRVLLPGSVSLRACRRLKHYDTHGQSKTCP